MQNTGAGTWLLVFFLAAVADASTPNAVKGQIIVKYKDSVTSCVHCSVKKQLGFGRSLKDLHSRYGVISARPVFRTPEEEVKVFESAGVVSTESLRQYHASKLERHAARFGTKAGRRLKDSVVPDLHHIYVLELSGNADVAAAVEEFARDPHVAYAQPNYFAEITFKPNDKYYRSSGAWGQAYDDLWALKQDKLNMAPAWDATQGEGIVVAVVDTGLDFTHPDISSNVWSSSSEIPNNNIDDDGNGMIDDDRGWDFTTCNEFDSYGECASPKDADNNPYDGHFHGTHVSGIIAAVGGNKVGIIGVAPRARILPVKGLNDSGRGQNTELAAAIVYAASQGADVINNSWSCGFCPRNPLYEDAVRTAHSLGSVVVFSAGNAARNIRGNSPQNMHESKPIVVSATDQRDRPTYFTNYGATVDVAAPGGDVKRGGANILSLRPGRCENCPEKFTVDNNYLRLAGTSMSAPHASGLAALVLAHRPTLNLEQVRHVLRSSAIDLGLPGFDLETGAGRLDAAGALEKAAPLEVVIEKPAHLSGDKPRAISINGTVTGPDLESYQLYYRDEGNTEWIPLGGSGSTPVKKGALGVLPGAGKDPGWRTIKIEATSRNGMKYEDVIDVGIGHRERRVPQNAGNNSHDPDISGDLVVWAEDLVEGVNGHIYVYDLKTRKKTRITTFPIASPHPTISGNVIAWLIDLDEGRGDGVFYCVFNRKTGKCPVSRLSSNEATGRPAVSGNYIVWYEAVNGREPIYLYNISTGEKLDIGDGVDADVSGDKVVWLHVAPTRDSGDLMLYDIKTRKSRRLTRSFPTEHDPKIQGDRIIFTRNHIVNRRAPHFDIYQYDLVTDTETKILEDAESSGDLDFDGNYLVWRHGEFELHAYNMESGHRQVLSFQPVAIRRTPRVSGKTVVWLRRDPVRQDNGEVFFTQLP